MPVVRCFNPATGASGGGGGGSTDPVAPPSVASEAVASGGSLADVTFSAFTGDGASDISSYEATKVNVVGSATISGSDLGAYEIAGEADDEVLAIRLDAKNAGGDILGSAFYVGSVGSSGGGGASWTTVHELDFTTDITDLTVSIGGGDTTLYEADGTTVKATVGFTSRIASTGGSFVITSAAGGALLTTTGASGKAQFAYIALTEAATGIDWDDGKLYAIDILTDQRDHGANAAFILVGVGTSASGINSGYTVTHRTQRVSASSWTFAARTRRGSTSDVGSTLTTSSSQEDAAAIRLIADRGGDLFDLYFTKGTTYLDGTPRPTAGAALWNGAGGTAVINTDDKDRLSGSTLYILLDHQSGGSAMTTRITKIRIQRLD